MITQARDFAMPFAVLVGVMSLPANTGTLLTNSLVGSAASERLHVNRGKMSKRNDELKRLLAGLNAVQEFFVDAHLPDGSGPENFMLHMQLEIGEEFREAAENGDIAKLRSYWRELISDVRTLESDERETVENMIRKSGAYSLYVNRDQLRKEARRIVKSKKINSESELQVIEDYWNFLRDTGFQSGEEEGEFEEFLGEHAKQLR